MQPANYYRFEKRTLEVSILEGSRNSYHIRDRQGKLVSYCEAVGECIKAPTWFKAGPDVVDVQFIMNAKGKILNLTYFLSEAAGAAPFATITAWGKGHWRVLDASDRELCRFIDPAAFKEKFYRQLLDGAADKYALLKGEEVVGRIRRDPRLSPAETASAGLLKRMLKSVLTTYDWVLDLTDAPGAIADHRPLLAGMILLHEHTIKLAQAAG